MNNRERVVAALELRQPDMVPVLEWAIDKKVAKGITGSENILDTVEELDLDGITIRPDYGREYIDELTYIDEWGSKRKITGDYIDPLIESPIKDLGHQHKYDFPDPHAENRFKGIEEAVKRFGKKRAVILGLRDIWSDMRDLLGYENALMGAVLEKENFIKLLDRSIEYNHTLAQIASKKLGIDMIVTTDDIADSRSLIFDPKLYFDIFAPRFKKVVKSFKDLGCYHLKHVDGNIMQIMDFLVECGIDCIDSIDPQGGMDLERIKKEYGDRICIKGNIDCSTILPEGPEERIEKAVKDCISKAAKGGGYILSSSNTIHSGIKTKYFKKMVDSARKYGKYPLDEKEVE